MAHDVVEIQDVPLRLTEEDVLRSLGSPDRAFPALEDEVTQGIAQAYGLCAPRVLSRRLIVKEVGRRGVSFVGGQWLEGRYLAHLFEGAEEAVFLVVTIGPDLEERVTRLFAEGHTIEAFILDAAGSASAMNLLTHVLGDINEETRSRGWQTGACLSPGQKYWDIREQESIFRVLPGERIGVELLESSYLRPQKSQSAVVPLGPDLKVLRDPGDSFCRYCPATRCPLRQSPQLSG
jgi:hypothetical protein